MAKIPIILESGRADGKLAMSDAIFDENKGMFQSEINDIQDTLNSDNPNKPLSAQQGKILKELIDAKVIEAGAVPMDSEPTEGNTKHVVTSDGIYKSLYKRDEKLSELEGDIINAHISDLDGESKLDTIKLKHNDSNKEGITIITNAGKVLADINNSASNFNNLQNNGKDVVTDISHLATKEALGNKQDVIPNSEIKEPDFRNKKLVLFTDNNNHIIHEVSESEANFTNLKSNKQDVITGQLKESEQSASYQSWESEDRKDVYAKITPNGIYAKRISLFGNDNVVLDSTLSKKYLAGAFHHWGFIGDSLSCGTIEGTDSEGKRVAIHKRDRSWPYRFLKYLNVEGEWFATPGQTARGWCTGEFGTSAETWQGASTNLQEAYIIALGENDRGRAFPHSQYDVMKDAEDNDIITFDESLFNINVDLNNYENNANSYVGWYCGIIQRLRSVNEKCFIFCCTNFFPKDSEYNKAVRYIASLFSNVYVLDFEKSNIDIYPYMQFSHLGTNGYEYAAQYTIRMISDIMASNPIAFKGIEFILENTNYKPY